MIRVITKLSMFVVFILIYIFMLSGVFFIFGLSGEKTFLQLLGMSYYEKFFMLFVLMSLGGLPPFMGFIGKIFVLKQTIMCVGTISLVALIFSSLIILFFYLGLTYFGISISSKILKRLKFGPNNFLGSLYFLRLVMA